MRWWLVSSPAAHEAFVAAAITLGIAAPDAEVALIPSPYAANAVALGDLAAALRQAQLRSDAPDAAVLRACVDAELAAREAQKGRRMGFMAAAVA